MAIVAVLIGLLVPALGAARGAASDVRTLANLRQLMIGYTVYSLDRDGALLPGVLNAERTVGMRLPDGYGGFVELPDNFIVRRELQLYPWRLASSLDVGLREIMLEEPQAERFLDAQDIPPSEERSGLGAWHYLVANLPSFGLNTYFLGGVYDFREPGSVPAYIPPFETTFRPAIRLSEVSRPSRTLTFATSRLGGGPTSALGGSSPSEGHHQVESPAWNIIGQFAPGPTTWSAALFSQDADAEQYGNLSGRLSRGRAGVAYTDGNVSAQEVESLRDMRVWAPNAPAADWEPPSPFSTFGGSVVKE